MLPRAMSQVFSGSVPATTSSVQSKQRYTPCGLLMNVTAWGMVCQIPLLQGGRGCPGVCLSWRRKEHVGVGCDLWVSKAVSWVTAWNWQLCPRSQIPWAGKPFAHFPLSIWCVVFVSRSLDAITIRLVPEEQISWISRLKVTFQMLFKMFS